MSSVSNLGNPTPSLLGALMSLGGTQAPSNASGDQGGGTVAFYETLPFQRLSMETLGLALPANAGDAEVLLAQVAMALENAVDKSRSEKLKAAMASLASSLGSTLANLVNQKQVQDDLDALNAQKTQTEGDITTAEGKLATDQQAQDTAQSTYNTAASNLSYWQGQVDSIDKSKDPTGYANAVSKRDAASAALTSADTALKAAKALVAQDQQTLSDLHTKLDGIKSNIDIKTGQMSALQAVFVALFASMAEMRSGMTAGLSDTEAGHDTQFATQLEGIFDRLGESSQNLTELMASYSDAQDVRNRDADLKKIVGAVVALVTGLVALVNALQSLQPPPQVDLGEAAIQQGSRLRVPA